MSNEDLHAWVRKSFAKWPKKLICDVMQSFLDRVVHPALTTSVSDCKTGLRTLTSAFTVQLVSGNLDEFSEVCAKIAQFASEGRFASRPAFMGMMLQCIDCIEREERGVESLKSQRLMSDAELELVKEAGSLLALNGCSEKLMHDLGFNKESCLRAHGKVDNLLECGLPCPALAPVWGEILEQNAACLHSLVPVAENMSHRRFVICFDFTYLLKLHAVMHLHSQKGVVGSPFHMKDLEPANGEFRTCFSPAPLKGTTSKYTGEKVKANRMQLAP